MGNCLNVMVEKNGKIYWYTNQNIILTFLLDKIMGTNYGYLDIFNKSSSFSQVIHKRMAYGVSFNQTVSLTLIFLLLHLF